jgi:hypothetical protein
MLRGGEGGGAGWLLQHIIIDRLLCDLFNTLLHYSIDGTAGVGVRGGLLGGMTAINFISVCWGACPNYS